MIYRIVSILVVATIFQLNLYAETPELPDAPSAVQPNVRSDLTKFADEQKKIKVTLNNSSFLTGKVQKIEEQSFVLVESKTGRTSQINFSDVLSVKKAGMSKGTKILIVVGVVGAFMGTMYGINCAAGNIHC